MDLNTVYNAKNYVTLLSHSIRITTQVVMVTVMMRSELNTS